MFLFGEGLLEGFKSLKKTNFGVSSELSESLSLEKRSDFLLVTGAGFFDSD